MKEEHEVNGKIKFNGNEISIIYPNIFDDFKKKLGEILGLNGDDILSNFSLSYNGETENIEIENPTDYQKFYNYAFQQNKLIEIKIEINEISSVDINKCSSNFITYKNKNSNNSNSINSLNNDNNKNNNIINQNNNSVNQNNNIINQNINIINQNNNIINQNNNIINNNNDNIIQNNKIIQNDIPQESKVEMAMLAFPVCCSICKGGPIYRFIYFCKECGKVFCPICEQEEGPKHQHAYLKIQTKDQYNHANLTGITKFDKFIDGIGSSIGNAYDSVLGFFGKGRNPNEESRKKQAQESSGPRMVSLVQIARTYYGLANFTDQQIEDALKATVGNIEEAAVLLISQNS